MVLLSLARSVHWALWMHLTMSLQYSLQNTLKWIVILTIALCRKVWYHCDIWFICYISNCENYFRFIRQNVWQAFNALPDILIPCLTFFTVYHRTAILVCLAGNFPRIEPCQTNCPQCWRPLPDISRSLPDMSDIHFISRGLLHDFNDNWYLHIFKVIGLVNFICLWSEFFLYKLVHRLPQLKWKQAHNTMTYNTWSEVIDPDETWHNVLVWHVVLT